MSESVGIRELRHNTSNIISAAEAGQEFHVTVRGKDTGVVIAKHPSASIFRAVVPVGESPVVVGC